MSTLSLASLVCYNFPPLLQVAASKTKIYMVLEYVNGGELFEKIVRIL